MRDVSYPGVRAYIAERKPQIRAEAGRGPAEVFIPQSHRPGAEAEVDFGEIVVRLAGELVSCSLMITIAVAGAVRTGLTVTITIDSATPRTLRRSPWPRRTGVLSSNLQGLSAINRQGHAGNEAGVVRSQEYCSVCDIPGASHSTA
jgi:hypothetical protein